MSLLDFEAHDLKFCFNNNIFSLYAKIMALLAVLHFAFCSSFLLYAFSYNDTQKDIFARFSDYIGRFNKSYHEGTMEFKKRESIFEQTLRRVEWLNRHRNNTQAALYGINQFSDLTPQEFKKLVHLSNGNSMFKKNFTHHKTLQKSNTFQKNLPKKIDWRIKNVITPVRNQDQCGACWAFSTVETIEAMYALKKGTLEEWSVQQVIDCAGEPNKGCDGGDTCIAIEWLYENKVNLVLAKDYPFQETTQTCRLVKSEKSVSISSNFTCDSFINEENLMLMHLAYHGPLVAAVDATGWQDYLGGIIQYHCDGERNHAVQIVGYDLTGNIPYYIVRNSWGTTFGNDGYLYIAIGKNICRIAEEVSALDVI